MVLVLRAVRVLCGWNLVVGGPQEQGLATGVTRGPYNELPKTKPMKIPVQMG